MPTTAPSIYPVALNLSGCRCLVVGGGAVAARKTHGLLEAAAAVTVVAPQVVASLSEWQKGGVLHLVERPFEPEDVEGMKLVFAATNSPIVNDNVMVAAQGRNILCSRVDGRQGSDFANMGVVQRGELTIAISTGGDSPAFTRWVREQVESHIGAEYGEFLRLLSGLRDEVKAQVPAVDRGSLWAMALKSDAFQHFCSGDRNGALRLLREELGLVHPV